MISKSFRYTSSLLVILFSFTSLYCEEKIDIWQNKKGAEVSKEKKIESKSQNQGNIKPVQNSEKKQSIKIENSISNSDEEVKIFGVYDPADYDFNLNMWASTDADDVRASIKRLKKINLSKTSNEILESVLLSFSFPPNGMNDKEFVKLKTNWLIDNKRSDLIENFLKQNLEFDGKDKVIQHLVDEKISQANIKDGCEKIKFIDSTIKDSYLEKFKIYCLVFNNKKSQAQLLLDLLREQKQSDSFFDDKINFLIGISDKTTQKINEKNLLNFYLSSITIKDFKYQPTKNTKKEIWQYLNAANLIKLEDVTDKEKLNELELAAEQGQLDSEIIFNIYKQIPFNLNNLINAKNIYQTLVGSDARSLIYQKYLLSENNSAKVEYLFILEELFKKDKLTNVFSEFLVERLKEIGFENIPDDYKEIAKRKMDKNLEKSLGKIKYNDKIFHQSKIIKFYVEKVEKKKVQKDLDKILKKISKDRKYFYSAKDIALIEALIKDGFNIPENFKKKELKTKYYVPSNLVQLIEKKKKFFFIFKNF